MLPVALPLMEVVLWAAAKAARAVTRMKRILTVGLGAVESSIESGRELQRGYALCWWVKWWIARMMDKKNHKDLRDSMLLYQHALVWQCVFTRCNKPAKLVPDRVAGIGG